MSFAFTLFVIAAVVALAAAVYSIYRSKINDMAIFLATATVMVLAAYGVAYSAWGTVQQGNLFQPTIFAPWASLPNHAMNIVAMFGLLSIVIGLGMGGYTMVRRTYGRPQAHAQI